jgi:hypothetical protein
VGPEPASPTVAPPPALPRAVLAPPREPLVPPTARGQEP